LKTFVIFIKASSLESRYRCNPRRPLLCENFLGNWITILLFDILP